MSHRTVAEYWNAYNGLPAEVRERADRAFEILKGYPGLQLKKVGRYWSARVGLDYRAVAVKTDDGFIWFWIGTHAEYDRLIR